MVTRQRQSASVTTVPALAQCFAYLCPAYTRLGRSARVYLHEHARSLFRFLRELNNEAIPSGVLNGLSESRLLEPLYVQVVHGNQAVAINKPAGSLMVKVRALILHMRVDA